MAIYATLAPVKILAQVKLNMGTGQNSYSTLTSLTERLPSRPILAIHYQLSVHGSTVIQSWR